MSLIDPLPQALLTDVFGTVVDWRSSITQALSDAATEVLNDPSASLASTLRLTGTTISWPDFAQQWRNAYYKFCKTYDPSSHASFIPISTFFRTSLESLLEQHQLTGLFPDSTLTSLTQTWHALRPWPDSPPGIALLSRSFTTSTLSNGDTTLLTALAAHGNLPYTTILSAQDFGAYKPNPRVYLGAAEKLGLAPPQCAMVAAHLADLQAARDCGMRTIYIEREGEEAWGKDEVARAKDEGWVDIWIALDKSQEREGKGGFVELARRLS